MTELLSALALAVFIEGVLFALFPGMTRRALLRIKDMPTAHLRFSGVAAAAIAFVVLWFLRA